RGNLGVERWAEVRGQKHCRSAPTSPGSRTLGLLPLLFLSALATACTTPPVAQARAPSPAPPERSFRAEAAPIALEVRQEAGEEGDAVAPPEPSPPPPHFEGRTAVTYMEFIDALRQ